MSDFLKNPIRILKRVGEMVDRKEDPLAICALLDEVGTYICSIQFDEEKRIEGGQYLPEQLTLEYCQKIQEQYVPEVNNDK